MKYLLIIYLLCIFCPIYSQSVIIKESAYLRKQLQEDICDTIYNYECVINNPTSDQVLLMFVEEELNDSCRNTVIRHRFLRHYNGLSISMLAWDEVTPLSGYTIFPEFFIKTIEPYESFILNIQSQKEKNDIHALMQKHLLICRAQELKDFPSCDFSNIVWGIKRCNFDYKLNSICFEYNTLNQYVDKQYTSVEY